MCLQHYGRAVKSRCPLPLSFSKSNNPGLITGFQDLRFTVKCKSTESCSQMMMVEGQCVKELPDSLILGLQPLLCEYKALVIGEVEGQSPVNGVAAGRGIYI